MKRNSFGLWLMMKLFEKHFEELSVSQMKEFVNVAAAAGVLRESGTAPQIQGSGKAPEQRGTPGNRQS